MRVESGGILPLTYYVTIMAGFVLIGFQELRRCRAMDTCCIAVDDVGPSPIVESCPASPLFDSVARWEFEAVNWQQEWKHILWTFHWRAFPKAIHRLETRLQQLEQHLHTAHADPKEVVETTRI